MKQLKCDAILSLVLHIKIDIKIIRLRKNQTTALRKCIVKQSKYSRPFIYRY